MPLYPPATTGVLQSAASVLASDQTTTSTTFGDLLTAAVTTSARSFLLIWISFTVSFTPNLSAAAMLRLTIDGTEYLRAGAEEFSDAQGGAIVYRASGLAAGAHTIALQWRISSVGAGTFRCRPVTAEPEGAAIVVMEVSV